MENIQTHFINTHKHKHEHKIQRIPKDDERYNMLLRIPPKIYLYDDDYLDVVIKVTLFESNSKQIVIEVWEECINYFFNLKTYKTTQKGYSELVEVITVVLSDDYTFDRNGELVDVRKW